MKVCPKCNSSYTDETLNFCLTDGVPLLEQESLSKENWQEAETIFDANLEVHQFPQRDTSPNSKSETNSKLHLKTNSFSTSQAAKSRPYLFPLLGVLAVLLAVGGIFWWLYVNPSPPANVANKQNPTGQKDSKRTTVPLTPEQENQVKKEVSDFLENWRATNEKKDIEKHISHYANTLEIYYDKSGVDKNIVRSDRLRAYQRYESISLGIDNAKVTPESADSATIVFDKTWTMKSAEKTSTGSVQQELHVNKQSNKWLINGEKDLKVYYINNRENQTDTNAAQNTNTNQ